jgi:nucleotide-binding universal stress UspA family protein
MRWCDSTILLPRSHQCSAEELPTGQNKRMVDLVVIGYDASPESGRAIGLAASALDAERAVVVNVWHDSAVLAGPVPVMNDAAAAMAGREEQLERIAFQVASEGASRARALGLPAVAEACGATSRAETGHVLVGLAEERNAALVVVGRSGGSLVREAVLGSVSGAAARDGRCPVLVVPS